MPDRDGYIPGVPCWVDTNQPDPRPGLPFYGGLFGWEFEDVMPEGPPGSYFMGRIRGGTLPRSVGAHGRAAEPTWNTYIWVDDVDETVAKVREAGGAVVVEPFDVMDAGRMAVVTDPEGAVFCVWQAGTHKGAKVVNEHGALNFNGLATRDRRGGEGASTGRCSAGRPGAARACRCGRCPATATTSRRRPPGSASRWSRWARPTASSTWSPRSTRSPPTTTHAAALERHLRRRRRRRGRAKAASSAARSSAGPRRAVDEDGDDQGPAGGDVHRQPVRPGEQGPRGVAQQSRAPRQCQGRASSPLPGEGGVDPAPRAELGDEMRSGHDAPIPHHAGEGGRHPLVTWKFLHQRDDVEHQLVGRAGIGRLDPHPLVLRPALQVEHGGFETAAADVDDQRARLRRNRIRR